MRGVAARKFEGEGRKMVTPALGIDVSKDRLDIEIAAGGKPRAKCFGKSPEGRLERLVADRNTPCGRWVGAPGWDAPSSSG